MSSPPCPLSVEAGVPDSCVGGTLEAQLCAVIVLNHYLTIVKLGEVGGRDKGGKR